MFKMKLDNFTLDIFGHIVKIYDQVVCGSGSTFVQDDFRTIHKSFKKSQTVERRYGSKLTSNSKLIIESSFAFEKKERLVSFSFFPNSDKKNIECELLINEFEQKVDTFLIEKDLVVM